MWTLLAVLGSSLVACEALEEDRADPLKASGVVEVVEVAVAPELAGRVVEVLVDEGDPVRSGEDLFRLEDEMLQSQHRQGLAALEAAQANLQAAAASQTAALAALETAQAGVEYAELQVELALARARFEDQEARTEAWDRDVPNEFNLPVWYFQKEEQIEAAEREVSAALEAMEAERENYEQVLDNLESVDLKEAEQRLSEAQAAYLVAEALSDRDIDANERPAVEDFVDTLFDAAEAELEDAQKDYEKILSEKAGEEVLEARARLAVMKGRFETARDELEELRTGEFALEVQAARAANAQAQAAADQASAGLSQAEAAVVQAEKAVAQARAALDAIEVRLEKLVVRAPVGGVVLTRNLEPGEVIQAGATAITLGQMDKMTITVYIPEDRYGQVNLGDSAQVMVDSFDEATFGARVVRIADQAEYTPRNVQTEEDRRTTVYAIELSVDDPEGSLKPGMPADVVFGG